MRTPTTSFILILIFLLLTSRFGVASNAEIISHTQSLERSAHYSALMRAKSLVKLRAATHQDQKLKFNRVKCRTELAARRIASACFWVIARENELHLLPAVVEIRDATWLKKLCVSQVESARSIAEIELAAAAELVPQECLLAMRSRIADLRYQLESSAPQSLFESRFPLTEATHDD